MSAKINNSGPKCEEGIVLPVWMPQEGLGFGDKFARGFIYFLGMLYMFIGVSIISDRFMASIEVITSKEKEIRVKRPNGDVQIVVVRVWNETVANLTLMALGSSAPEILLSIIEIMGKSFDAGDFALVSNACTRQKLVRCPCPPCSLTQLLLFSFVHRYNCW